MWRLRVDRVPKPPAMHPACSQVVVEFVPIVREYVAPLRQLAFIDSKRNDADAVNSAQSIAIASMDAPHPLDSARHVSKLS
jgi:hypothetical protein